MSDGSTASKAYAVPAEGRRSVWFNGEATLDPALAALAMGPVWFTVSSTQPIVAERAMWWPDWPWYEGHAAPGSATSNGSWAVAEGRHGGVTNEQTYVLIGNTASTAGQVRITLIPNGPAPVTRELPIAAAERLTVNVGSLFELTDGPPFSVIVESLGSPGVPLAVDYARYRSVNGLVFSGGGAAPAVPFSLTPGDTAPTVTATTPANGATAVDPNANLSVTFSESVSVTASSFTLSCNSTPITVAIQGGVLTGTQFTLDPSANLPPSTPCTLTVVASTVTDTDTNDPPDEMAANTVVAFTTASDGIPAVSSTTPASSATGVDITASLQVTFNEPVTVTGAWFQVVCATSGARTVTDTVVTGGPPRSPSIPTWTSRRPRPAPSRSLRHRSPIRTRSIRPTRWPRITSSRSRWTWPPRSRQRRRAMARPASEPRAT
jgi:hypothetical protein